MYLLALAIVPIILCLLFVYTREKTDKEPKLLIAKMFFLGLLMLIPIVIVEDIAGNAFNINFDTKDGLVIQSENIFYLFVYAFVGIGLVEEGFKFIALRLGIWKNLNFDRPFDGIVYSVSVSLGFAAIENIGYVFQFGAATGAMRAFTSIPGHTMMAIFMGYYFGRAKFCETDDEKRLLLFKSIVIPTIIHGLYDFLIMSHMPTILFVLFLITTVILSLKMLSSALLLHGFKPIQTQVVYKYAGFFRRLGAFIIDYVIIFTVIIIIVSCIQSELGMPEFHTEDDQALIGEIAILGNLFLSWIYFTTMEMSKLKATIGKMVFGLVVTNEKEEQLSFGISNARYWSKFFSVSIFFIGYIMIAFTDKKQALHDIIAKTLVLRAEVVEVALPESESTLPLNDYSQLNI